MTVQEEIAYYSAMLIAALDKLDPKPVKVKKISKAEAGRRSRHARRLLNANHRTNST